MIAGEMLEDGSDKDDDRARAARRISQQPRGGRRAGQARRGQNNPSDTHAGRDRGVRAESRLEREAGMA